MSRRKYHLRPPTSSGYKSGQVLTFAASDEEVRPSELVELTPVGPAPTVYELRPEDDRVNAGKPLPPPVELTPAGPPNPDAPPVVTRPRVSKFSPLPDEFDRAEAETDVDSTEAALDLWTALGSLKMTDLERAIIRGHYQEGLALKELAPPGVSPGAVYKAHERLLMKLRNALSAYDPGVDPPPPTS